MSSYLSHLGAWLVGMAAIVAVLAPFALALLTENGWWMAPYGVLIPVVGALFSWMDGGGLNE